MNPPAKTVAYLVDYAPRSWDTRTDMLFRLCQALVAESVVPVMVFSEALPETVRARFTESGAVISAPLNYRERTLNYAPNLREFVRRYSVGLLHIRYFPYHTAIPWMARAFGVRHVVFTEANSGEWQRTGLHAALIRARARVMTFPLQRVVAISEFIKRRLVDIGIEEQKIEVIYNGIEPSRYQPDPYARQKLAERFPIRPDETLILSISSLLPWKDTRTIVESVGILERRGTPVRLFVAGTGILESELKKLCEERGIAHRTHWLGHVADSLCLFQGCDVFALASIGEAFGNVLAEAMASELPVVATRSGGTPEVVEDGRTGMLVPPKDPPAFANALERLARFPDLRREMGRKGRTRVLQRFTLDSFVERTMRLYQSLP